MKKTIVILSAALMLCTGCDFLRMTAGRPTSADIQEKKERIAKIEQQKAQARQDSIRRAEEKAAAEHAVLERHILDSLSHAKGTIIPLSRLGGISAPLASRYYIIVGAFQSLPNAEKKLASCASAGYVASIIRFKSGLNAVALCPSDDIVYTVKMLSDLRRGGLCPEDGWILSND